ncbi:anthranilate synthase component I [Edaphobacter sp. 12200R-103]|uniref:anthranilate synthase component I n=1 Tax=Edaphobacter sp. 12200R-103 TaxID=2703788 RepID=UPI00138BFFB6|nr:anthranilate synthase component I [Edaphobacter sp. 12200R-103]QHS52167.1 anthranilate synthase component I [Edaphobacter sp. 12200R-103]
MPVSSTNSLPSERDFLRLGRTHTLVPVYRTVAADLETPVSAFLRIAAEEPEAFLLESVEGGEHVGRYTFIGIEPYKKMISRGDQITVREGRKTMSFTGDIFTELKKALSGHRPAKLSGLPPFTAGAVGFFAYDVVRQIEKLPATAKDELGVPDACLMFFDQVLAFDHVKKEIHLIVTVDLARERSEGAHARAVRRLNRLEKRLHDPLPAMKKRKPLGKLKLEPRTPKAKFLKGVEKTKEYIAAGDVFQCVLSQRFDCEPGVDAFEIYRALRIVNPSPYMYFLRFGLDEETAKKKPVAHHIVGSSPELLVRVHGRDVEYRPIAGTRPRSADEVEDRRIEAELRDDEKERAEHIMLVDLGRNDVGRVSEFGSVKVKDLMFVERYSHVMHLVSALEGRLKDGLTPIDALRACFPAGTLSGAPKVRAMEIIEELEPSRRGVYGGSVLYADFSGNLDSCIAIRTLYMNGPHGHIQSGGGVVADSVPIKEYEESVNKAKAVVRAIERARG